MSDFDTTRLALTQARSDLASRRAELYRVQQETARLEARLARAQRGSAPGSDAEPDLANMLKRARAEEVRRRTEVRAQEIVAAERERAFATFSDPRDALVRWSGDTPILLLPVRLETRFRRIESGEGGTSDELWVRIFPDDCAVESFEETLSEAEVASGRRFWIAVWAAGGIESQRRAAWRDLVAARGAGRAAWIVKQFAPEGAEPVKASEEDVLLVMATEQLPPSPEQTALAAYWKAVWRADGAREATDEAASSLAQSLGITRTEASALVARHVPVNLTTKPVPPHSKSDITVEVAWLALPAAADSKTRSWTAPAQVHVMPDRFVVIGYQDDKVVFEAQGAPIPSPLIAGPDPSAPPDEQLQHDAEGELSVPDAMRWMVDFDRALEVGMGVKVPLDTARVDLSRPITRVIAIGLRLSDDSESGRARLEGLLTNHRYGHQGFAFVPQGTPTNNTEGDSAGYRRDEDADAAYDALFGPTKRLTSTPDWWQRQDGQWLADALGIDVRVFEGVVNASARDFAEARAMNRALWPATLGYALETMLHPVMSAAAVDATRWFYSHFVSGRGLLPCLRIGEQPYGVLPVGALSRWTFGPEDRAPVVGGLQSPQGYGSYLQGLQAVLAAMRSDWAKLARAVSFVGKSGDAHQLLLDVIGLHPASVEFHQRHAESLHHIFNRAKFHGVGAQLLESIRVRGLQQPAMDLLRRLGYQGAAEPDALQRFFFGGAQRLNGPVVDDRPLSERDPIRAYTADDRNYMAWLADSARESFDDLRLERGFKDDRPPDALLYAMLRHALLLGYWDSSLRLHLSNGAMDAAMVSTARRESPSIHLGHDREASESRFVPLYSKNERVTGDPKVTVAERVGELIGRDRATSDLADQLAAVDLLEMTPTARLERCFAEHIDTASHRLDAWLLGLVHLKLAAMRYRAREDDADGETTVETRRGIYLGACGWLENLQRKQTPLQPVQLSDELGKVFAATSDAPLLRDPTNGGYVLAPSIGQAATAAILRAGYLANASPQAPDALAVNLSSSRVRTALALIEGIRTGQPLGALLGYRLQRGLHENHAPLELDRFIHALRQQFPLVANQLASTRDATAPIETIEANNVVDGLRLLEHVRKPGNRSYPFNLPLPGAAPAETAAIDEEVTRLLDAQAALADLALAEGVHQSVLGNYDHVAATMDAYAKGTFPPEPDVVRTPRSAVALTHRVGIHFEAPVASPVATAASPRAHAQAMVNKWLAAILPSPSEIACRVEWLDPVTRSEQEAIVTQGDLGLQPIDLLYIAALDGEAAMGELDDRIVRHVVRERTPRSDAVLGVRHTVRLPEPMKTFFEVAPLLRHLRAVLLRSRPLSPTDIALPGEAERAHDATQSIDRDRVKRVWDELKILGTTLGGFDPDALTVDAAIDEAVVLFELASRFGLQQVGWGFLYEWRRRAFSEVLSRVQNLVTRWNRRLDDFVAGFAAYGLQSGAMTSEERFDALSRLDGLLAALPVSPRPASPAAYEVTLDDPGNPQSRLQLFADKLARLQALLGTADPNLATLLTAVEAELPLTAFDVTPFSLVDVAHDVVTFKADLHARMTKLESEVEKRLMRSQDQLAVHDASTSASVRVGSLQAAGGALLGEDVQLIPEFTFAPGQAAELANAYTASSALTTYLRTVRKIEFPVDDWLHGIARVREKLFCWEQAAVLAPTLGGTEPVLSPVQLPFRAGEGWLALEFDPQQKIDGERLLYTAHHAVAPNAAAATCGLLIDEWTEVLPTRDETIGLTFQYDRPGSEPPQVWLLAAPQRMDGEWQWSDLLGAVEEAFELAKLRAVEPTQVDSTAYARFLPATTSAVTLYGLSIALNYARVNAVDAFIERSADG
ncbi:MAG: hypothetical protein U0Q12_10140 [Vicinamibacterales bacterium]